MRTHKCIGSAANASPPTTTHRLDLFEHVDGEGLHAAVRRSELGERLAGPPHRLLHPDLGEHVAQRWAIEAGMGEWTR